MLSSEEKGLLQTGMVYIKSDSCQRDSAVGSMFVHAVNLDMISSTSYISESSRTIP